MTALCNTVSSTARVFIGAVALSCGGVPQAAWSQGPPPASLPQGQKIGMTAEIDALLQKMLAAYRALESYQDDGRVSLRQVNGRVRQITKMPSTTHFRRPNLLQVVGGMQSISCDGKELQIVLDNLNQYTQVPAPAALTMQHVRYGAPGGGLDSGYPELLEFLIGKNVYPRWLSQIQRIQLAQFDEPKKIGDRPVHTIYYETVHKALVSMWIDQETNLLLRFDVDNTQAQRPGNAPPLRPGETLPTMEVAVQLDPVVINAKPGEQDGDAFALRTPEHMKKVERFDPGMEAGAPPEPPVSPKSPLLGKALPVIAGTSVDGKPLDSSRRFKGKVGLVFFWNPTGDPGSLTAVHMVQRLAKRFEKSSPGLSILSVTTPGQDPAFVKDIIAAKKAEYPVLIDPDGRFQRAFSLAGVPAVVIAGADGTVHKVFDGSPVDMEPKLVSELESLLGGGAP